MDILFEIFKLKGNEGIARKVDIMEKYFLIFYQLIAHCNLGLTYIVYFTSDLIQLVSFVNIEQIVVYLSVEVCLKSTPNIFIFLILHLVLGHVVHRIYVPFVIERIFKTEQVRYFESKNIQQHKIVFKLPYQFPLFIMQNFQLAQVIA